MGLFRATCGGCSPSFLGLGEGQKGRQGPRSPEDVPGPRLQALLGQVSWVGGGRQDPLSSCFL